MIASTVPQIEKKKTQVLKHYFYGYKASTVVKAWQGYERGMGRVWQYLQNFTTSYLSDLYHSWAICRAFNNLGFLSHKIKFAFNRKVRVWKNTSKIQNVRFNVFFIPLPSCWMQIYFYGLRTWGYWKPYILPSCDKYLIDNSDKNLKIWLNPFHTPVMP